MLLVPRQLQKPVAVTGELPNSAQPHFPLLSLGTTTQVYTKWSDDPKLGKSLCGVQDTECRRGPCVYHQFLRKRPLLWGFSPTIHTAAWEFPALQCVSRDVIKSTLLPSTASQESSSEHALLCTSGNTFAFWFTCISPLVLISISKEATILVALCQKWSFWLRLCSQIPVWFKFVSHSCVSSEKPALCCCSAPWLLE